jgi:hypothetical protein
MGHLHKLFRKESARDARRQREYRVFRIVDPASVPNPWTRRLLQLADGRPAMEIAEAISREPHTLGPLTLELGVGSPLMRRGVYESLADMVSLGLVRFEPMESVTQPTFCR